MKIGIIGGGNGMKARELIDLIERGNLHDFEIKFIEHRGFTGGFPNYEKSELEITDVGYSDKVIVLNKKD
jgi:hypothetical protein